MKEKKQSKYIVAHLLLAVFIGITLMKPIHLFLDHHILSTEHSDQQSHNSHDNCTICQFTFALSTEAKAASVVIVYNHLIAEIQACGNEVSYKILAKHTTSRAPPADLA